MTHQTIGERGEVLTSEDLAALREQPGRVAAVPVREKLAGSSPPTPRSPPVRSAQRRAEHEVARPRTDRGARQTRRLRPMGLADVEAALTRMDTGTYGICHLCRRPVQRDRLLIVPQARYCARCQQVREAAR
ncbi:conserved hypothetical protein [Streptomyces viridosporus ATCC 14672]|uniref:Zinc finger DksA/TraR C4-type domain-containing protein n=1 Tax=Streptomyces viridosporus (strain ATCC 14672 / DSM 40746 / JCM 4963 / KCTC 9882 / NRRL B-12104 / FH 1290) TaxID=566461 RepID=D6A1K8_STRV1|nr:conserved hypothetical protein [Streptomyces viridosporus ATCC 14672]